MTTIKPKRIALLLLCVTLSTAWSYEIRHDFQGPLKLPDFAPLYYGAQCALRHCDPYNPDAVLRQFRSERPGLDPYPLSVETARVNLTVGLNLPTVLLVTAPISLLPWTLAQSVWIILGAATLVLAAFLMCDLADGFAIMIPTAWAAFMLANCEVLFTVGNLAGITIGLALISVWCFLKNRFAPAGVVLFAFSLVLKPHDVGFVWLYFLLAGGTLRRRALQTLVAVGLLGLIAAVWIAPSSPQWVEEMHRNVGEQFVSGHASINAPSLAAETNRTADQVIDLQAAISIFKNDPHFYNPASYLIAGSVILLWAIAVLRKRFSVQSALLALAAIAPLSVLPVYHRTHDAKIILLALPACAALWAGKGPRRWIALALTSAAVFVTSDIPLLVLFDITRNLPSSPSTLTAKITDLLLLQPAPLVFLVTGCFYLWVYVRSEPAYLEHPQSGRTSAPVQFESAR